MKSASRGAVVTALAVIASALTAVVPAVVLPASATPPTNQALSWGRGEWKALGNGSTNDAYIPGPVSNGANTSGQWSTTVPITGGYDFTCGLGADQHAYCWGTNNSGDLGDGTLNDSLVPVQVAEGANTGGLWTFVMAGSDSQVCGLAPDQHAYCWGKGADGYLGNGSTSNSPTPVLVSAGDNSAGTWKSINVGEYAACGVATDDHIYCWGYADYGALPIGTTVSQTVPKAILFGDNTAGTWKSVAQGDYGGCGIGMDDHAYCWGYNDYGYVGDGTTTQKDAPTLVIAGENAANTYTKIYQFGNNTCGVGTDGNAYCWGSGGYGALGNGSDTDVSSPVKVLIPGSETVLALSPASYSLDSVCALTTSHVYCWGSNGYGQLGNGTTTDTNTPVEWTPPAEYQGATVKTIGSGYYTMFAVVEAPTGTAPSAPRSVTAVPRDGSALVNWKVPSDTGSSAITGYTVTSDPGNFTCGPTTDLNCEVTGLQNGTPYTFTVVATNGVGDSPDSAASTAVTPQAVTPAPGPAPAPRPLTPGHSALVVDGVVQSVTVDPNPSSSGLEISGTGFSMTLDGLDGAGNPLELGPGGSLVLKEKRDVQATGDGFLADSNVALFIDPPVARSRAISVGSLPTDGTGTFGGTATLPRSISPGKHVLQAVGYTPTGGKRSLSLGVIVRADMTLHLAVGTRTRAGQHDRVTTTGTSTAIAQGTKITPFVRYGSKGAFVRGTGRITIGAKGTFTFTRLVARGRDITVYVAYRDASSNRVTWARLR